MAGIGFELQRALERRTYTAYLQAYLTAAAYSSGPWICTLIALVLITGTARPVLGVKAVNEFTSVLVYVYAASLLIAGSIQLVLTRYVADCLYREDRDGVLSGVVDALALTSVISGLVGYAFCSYQGLPFTFSLAATFLLVTVSCLWVEMAYLTCVKKYQAVTATFAGGAAASVVLAIGLALQGGMGAMGLVLGYAIGHVAMLAGLFSISTWEFRFERRALSSFLGYFTRMPGVALVGFLMNMALWMDKFLVWAVWGVEEVPGFPSRWQYDIPAYLAYLSVLPSQAFFLIKIETRFEDRYQAFLTAVMESPGEIVARRKQEMYESLRDGLVQLFKFQGVISLVVLLLAKDLLIALRLHTLDLPLFQGLLLGAYCHFGLLHVLVFMMYLDRRHEMIRILTGFCLITGVGTYAVLQVQSTPGVLWCAPYVVAATLCLLVAVRRVLALTHQFDYHLLFRQELRDADERVIRYVPDSFVRP